MSTWDEVISTYGDDISKASEEYIQASKILPFSVNDIQAVFSKEEMEDVAKFVKEMKQATADNNRKYQLITQYQKVVVGLLKLAKIAI